MTKRPSRSISGRGGGATTAAHGGRPFSSIMARRGLAMANRISGRVVRYMACPLALAAFHGMAAGAGAATAV